MGILSQRKLSKIASFNVTAYFFQNTLSIPDW